MTEKTQVDPLAREQTTDYPKALNRPGESGDSSP